MNVIQMGLYSEQGEIVVIPLGDFHIGEESFNTALLKDTVAEILSHDNWYAILGGDYIQNNITKRFDGIFNEVSPDTQLVLAKEYLMPLAIPDEKHPYGRILCMVEGNHEARTTNETGLSPAQVLCSALSSCGNGLDKRYSDTECFLFLTVSTRGKKKEASTRYSYTIDVTHGTGGGATMGSAMNALARMCNRLSGCMCYVMFHHHKPMVAKQDHLHAAQGKVQRETQLLVMGNAFADAKYAERKSLPLTSKTVPRIRFYARRVVKKKNGKVVMDQTYKNVEATL